MNHTIDEVQLTDALKGIFIHVPGAPVIDFEVNFRSGYQFTSEEKYDVPHLLEHLISGDNKVYKGRKAVRRAMDKHGAYHNAYTSYYYNRYVFEAPLFDTERLLDVQLAALTSPAFTEDEFVTEKAVVADELSSNRNNFGRELAINLDRAMGTDVLDYSKRLELVQDLTLEDVEEYYKRSHTQKNSRFIVAGDLSDHRDLFEDKIRTGLAKLPKGEYWEFEERDTKPEAAVHLKRDVQATVYKIRFVTQEMTEYRDDIVMNLMNLMLTGTWNSMIFGEGRDKGILYGINSGANRGKEHSTFGLDGSTQSTSIKDVLEFIGIKLKEMKNGEFDDELLEEAKQFRKGQFIRSYQTSWDVRSWYYGGYSFDDEINHLDTYIPTIESITTDDIIGAAKKLFQDEIWGFGLLTSKDEDNIDADELQEVLRKAFSS